jgi:formate-dependent nitrite reductase membrane component NrfD
VAVRVTVTVTVTVTAGGWTVHVTAGVTGIEPAQRKGLVEYGVTPKSTGVAQVVVAAISILAAGQRTVLVVSACVLGAGQ